LILSNPQSHVLPLFSFLLPFMFMTSSRGRLRITFPLGKVHIFPYIYFLFFKTKSLLKVRLRCKACHAEERAAFRSTICYGCSNSAAVGKPHNSASATSDSAASADNLFHNLIFECFTVHFIICSVSSI